MTGLLITVALIGLIPAAIAQRKGHNFFAWWLFGAALFIVALPAALVTKPDPETRRQCPMCRSWIDKASLVCAQCGRDIPPPETPAPSTAKVWPAEDPDPFSREP